MYLNTYRMLPCMEDATDKNILQNYIKSTSIVLRFIIFYVFITFRHRQGLCGITPEYA